MRSYDSATAAYLASRDGIVARHLVFFTAKDRATGLPVSMGLWTGDDHQTFTISGQSRTYYAAGAMIGMEALTSGIGLDVRMHQIALSPLTDEVALLIRGYDTRLAPVEIHRAVFDLSTGNLVGTPFRVFQGWVNKIALNTGALGGGGEAIVTIASASRALTRPLNLFRSDAAQRTINSADAFRAYTDIGGEVGVWWGESKQ